MARNKKMFDFTGNKNFLNEVHLWPFRLTREKIII